MTYTDHEQRQLDQDSGAVWDRYIAKRAELEQKCAAQRALTLKLERTQDLELLRLAR